MFRPTRGARFAEDIQTDQTQTYEDQKKQDKGQWKMIKPGQSTRVYTKESWSGLEILKITDEDDTKFAMALGWPVGRHSDPTGQEGIANVAMKALADGTCANKQVFKTFAKDKGGGGSCTADNSKTVCLMATKKYNPEVTKCFLQNVLNPTNLAGLDQAKKNVRLNLKNQKRGWVNAAIMDAQAAATSPQAKIHLGSNEFMDLVDEDMVYKWLNEHLSIGMARLIVYGNVDVISLLNDIKPLKWPQDPVIALPQSWPAAKTAWPAESRGLFMIRHNTDKEKQRTLKLQWIFDGRPDMSLWQTHPSYTLCEVFDSDDKVALKEFMKSKSLIHGLSCGGIQDPAHWRVQFSITLTESAKVDTVLHVVNYYISQVLNTETAVKALMESLAKRSAINWEIAEELTGVKAANAAIAQFIYFPAEWVLKARRSIVKLDEPALFGLIAGMKPSNLNIMLDEIHEDRFGNEKAKNNCEVQTLSTGDEYWVGENSRKENLESWFATDPKGGLKKSVLLKVYHKIYGTLPTTPPPVVVPDLSEDDFTPQNLEPRDLSLYADGYYGEKPVPVEEDEGAELWIREGWVKSNSLSGKLNLALEIMRDPGQERSASELACLGLYGSVLHEQYSSDFDEMANYPKTGFTWWKGSGGITLTISTLKSLMEPIGEAITETVLKGFKSVDEDRWNKLLKRKQDNPLGRSTAHPRDDASDIKYLVVRSERYSEDEWLDAYNGLKFENTEGTVTAYYQKYPMLLTGLAMGAVDEEAVKTLFTGFKAMLNAVSAEESGDRVTMAAKTFGSVKILKQPVEVRHSTAGKDDMKNYENNVADVTLFTGIQTVLERVLDQQISQYMPSWVEDYKKLIDERLEDEFVFSTSLGSVGSAVRTWTSKIFSTKTQVDELELLIEVFHLQVVPRLITSLDTADLVTKIQQWLQGVAVKKLPSTQLDHYQYHLDLPQGSFCFDRLNEMRDAFSDLKEHPEKAVEMMLDRWLTMVMSPARKRLVVKVSKDLPEPSERKSPELSSTEFAKIYKDKELKDVENEAVASVMDGLKHVFSDGTFIITEPVDSNIRKQDEYYDGDYPIDEFCFLEEGWDDELEEEEMDEE